MYTLGVNRVWAETAKFEERIRKEDQYVNCVNELNILVLIDSNKSPTRCNHFTVYYPDVYLQLNMFRALSRPSSGAQ